MALVAAAFGSMVRINLPRGLRPVASREVVSGDPSPKPVSD